MVGSPVGYVVGNEEGYIVETGCIVVLCVLLFCNGNFDGVVVIVVIFIWKG